MSIKKFFLYDIIKSLGIMSGKSKLIQIYFPVILLLFCLILLCIKTLQIFMLSWLLLLRKRYE